MSPKRIGATNGDLKVRRRPIEGVPRPAGNRRKRERAGESRNERVETDRVDFPPVNSACVLNSPHGMKPGEREPVSGICQATVKQRGSRFLSVMPASRQQRRCCQQCYRQPDHTSPRSDHCSPVAIFSGSNVVTGSISKTMKNRRPSEEIPFSLARVSSLRD